jgi:AcrR family transcriptional regulator
MRTTARLLRNSVTRIDRSWDKLTDREDEQRTRIMDLGQALMAIHGRHTITMAAFALAIGRTTAHIRRHFPDLDSLLAHILHRHLRNIARALGEASRTHPDNQPALREAYAAATRTGLAALTEPHLLLTRDRHLLPADELEFVERTRAAIGETIAGELGRMAMVLLDEPGFHPATIEHMLAEIHEARTAPPRSAGWAARSPQAPPANPSPRPDPRPEPDWSSPKIRSCLPQGWRPEPKRTPQARAGPRKA